VLITPIFSVIRNIIYASILVLISTHSGYFRLWIHTNSLLSSPPQSASSGSVYNLCMGGDWYTFPSHFFLPKHVNFSYVEDNFHGLLPQPYDVLVGTGGQPLLPVNGLNAEEKSHYVELSSCSHLVMTTPSEKFGSEQYTPLQRRVLLGPVDADQSATADSIDEEGAMTFKRLHCEDILDAPHSPSALYRAFYVPFAAASKNEFMKYCLYSQEE
jgi:alpha-1,2-mannosyltransferase